MIKTLIYPLPNFYDEVLYISDDGLTVFIEQGSFFKRNLNQPLFTLYKNGKKVKEYKLYTIYNLPIWFCQIMCSRLIPQNICKSVKLINP